MLVTNLYCIACLYYKLKYAKKIVKIPTTSVTKIRSNFGLG